MTATTNREQNTGRPPASTSSAGGTDLHSKADRPSKGIADRRRQRLTIALGTLWLLDAALQFQPYLYTSAFPDSIRAAGPASPAWLGLPSRWAADLIATNVPVWNTVFALTQLLIGVGLFTRRYRKVTLGISIAWALSVWSLGEGFGAFFAGSTDAVVGFPGAALLYAIVAMFVWPPPRSRRHLGSAARAAHNGHDTRAAQNHTKIIWTLLWGGLAIQTIRSAGDGANALHNELAGQADGEPAWLQSVDHAAATWATTHQGLLSAALLISFTLIALAGLARSRQVRTFGAGLATAIAALVWIVGQNFGGILTGHATDPNSGPLLALLALCILPAAPRRGGTRSHYRSIAVTEF